MQWAETLRIGLRSGASILFVLVLINPWSNGKSVHESIVWNARAWRIMAVALVGFFFLPQLFATLFHVVAPPALQMTATLIAITLTIAAAICIDIAKAFKAEDNQKAPERIMAVVVFDMGVVWLCILGAYSFT